VTGAVKDCRHRHLSRSLAGRLDEWPSWPEQTLERVPAISGLFLESLQIIAIGYRQGRPPSGCLPRRSGNYSAEDAMARACPTISEAISGVT
jgi:hypothetical protein